MTHAKKARVPNLAPKRKCLNCGLSMAGKQERAMYCGVQCGLRAARCIGGDTGDKAKGLEHLRVLLSAAGRECRHLEARLAAATRAADIAQERATAMVIKRRTILAEIARRENLEN